MIVKEILNELQTLGNERTRKQQMNRGVSNSFGVSNKNMKPLAKEHKHNTNLAIELYNTRNYDAMYLAGMMINPKEITESIIEDWIFKADNYMIGDYIVSVSLAETPFALTTAKKWIMSNNDIQKSAGWSTGTWVLGVNKDENINVIDIRELLTILEDTILKESEHIQSTMLDFVVAVAVSYKPLHEEAYKLASTLGSLQHIVNAKAQIESAIEKNRIGFKRKNVRC
ncbi:MAG: DNA alkylation repair protein [Coprobacillaceae bacterium]